MKKHKISMVTRNNPHLVIVILSDEVVEMKCFLPCLDKYLFSAVSGNRYMCHKCVINLNNAIDNCMCSKENVLSSTITRNVTMYR